MIEIGFIISAFIAGLLMFLAPCTLPMVPAYLAFISGVKPDEFKDPKKVHHARRAVIINGIAFVIGFTGIFVLFGMAAGFFGQQIAQYRIILGQIGGAFIILFGLMMLGVLKITPLMRDRRMKMPGFLTPGKPSSAFIVGSSFAFGWTPCVGPILASILLLASANSTVFSGGFLLLVFSLGLAVPFLVTAFGFSYVTEHIGAFSNRILRYRVVILAFFGFLFGFIIQLLLVTKLGELGGTLDLQGGLVSFAIPLLAAAVLGFIAHKKTNIDIISTVGGLFLIILGYLLLTNQFGLTIEYGYRIFNFLNYDALLDYL